MRKRFTSVLLVISVLAAVAVPSASAATEFGDNCSANEGSSETLPFGIFELSAPGNPLPATAPSAGVLTRWSVTSSLPGSRSVGLRVLHLSGNGNEKAGTGEVLGESSGTVNPGLNSFPVRIPVTAGAVLSLTSSGSGGFLICDAGTEKARYGIALGSSSVVYETGEESYRVPVSGLLEPDVDGDGYGDQTQDGCPQSAAYHTACPLVTLGTANVVARSAVTVLVTTDAPAPVLVSGTVVLGKGKTAKLTAAAQTVAPGQLARFTLAFPTRLKSKLKGLARGRSLKLSLAASATNVAGAVSNAAATVKLKGEGK